MKTGNADLLADGFKFLEAPKWHDGRIWLSDVFDLKLVSVTLDGRRQAVCDVPQRPAGQGGGTGNRDDPQPPRWPARLHTFSK